MNYNKNKLLVSEKELIMIDKLQLTCPKCSSPALVENQQPQPGESMFTTIFQCGAKITIITESEKGWEWDKNCLHDLIDATTPIIEKMFKRLINDLNTLTAAPISIELDQVNVLVNRDFRNTKFNKNVVLTFVDKNNHYNNGFFFLDSKTCIAITGLMMMVGSSSIKEQIKAEEFTAEIEVGFEEVAHQLLHSCLGSFEKRNKFFISELEIDHFVNTNGLVRTIASEDAYLIITFIIRVADFKEETATIALSHSLVNTLLKNNVKQKSVDISPPSTTTKSEDSINLDVPHILKTLNASLPLDMSNVRTKQPTIIYAREEFTASKNSIFLAGPIPRDKGIQSWRSGAIDILKRHNFEGTILLPEDRVDFSGNYENAAQIEWEASAMKSVTTIVFWVPRELEKMPAFTTNVEFGYWIATNPNKIILGSPPNTPKMAYLRYYCEKLNIPNFYTLEETLIQAIMRIK
jgi:hypothetical protein